LSQSTRVTDGETDRQTDRILITRLRLHSMQRGNKNSLAGTEKQRKNLRAASAAEAALTSITKKQTNQ